jgi:hypothetical protein
MKQLRIPNYSTTAIANVSLVLTVTASSILTPSFELHAEGPIEQLPEIRLSQQREWEQKISGSDASGGDVVYLNDYRNFMTVRDFSQRMLEESTDLPQKYDAVFMANIEDLLA